MAKPDKPYRHRTIGNHALRPETLMMSYGYEPRLSEGSVKCPLFQTSTFVFERAGCAPVPDDLPLATAVDLFDVCAAASQVDELVFEGADVSVLGAGHAGRLALATAGERAASLTVVDVDDTRGSFTVSLIPETLERTTLGRKSTGEPVNLEVDVVAKYVERMLGTRFAPSTDEEE